MRKVVIAATFILVAACSKPAAEANDSALDAANASGNAAHATVVNAIENSDLRPVDKMAALRIIKDRHDNYERIGKAMKAAKRALDANPADVATVRSSATTIADLAPQVPGWFPAGSGPESGGKTGALPEIWSKADVFAKEARGLVTAANAFKAAAAGGDAAAMKAGFATLGKSCKSCHDQFRKPDHD